MSDVSSATDGRLNPDGSPRRCDSRNASGDRCSKLIGHASDHRFPIKTPVRARTLAQALGSVETCGARKVAKINHLGDSRTSICRKPRGHHSQHHDGTRSWA